MKHTPFRLFAAALTLLSLGLSSCQETERESLAPEEAEWSITVTASLPGAPAVRSGAAPGEGTAVNRCILEVYENGEFSGDRYVAPVQDLGAVFEGVHLVAGGTYDLVFWADCAAEGEDGGLTDLYYGTEAGLTQITLDTDCYTNSDDGHDAFCAVLSVVDLSDDQPLEATLTRPFGQVRLYTDDLDWLPAPVVDLTQVRAEVAFSRIYTVYNALTGGMSGLLEEALVPAEVSVPVDFVAGDDAAAPTGQISFDYFLASPEEDQTLIDFTLTLTDASTGARLCAPFTASSIPLQRNWITNVHGNFLTRGLDITVDLVPAFTGVTD